MASTRATTQARTTDQAEVRRAGVLNGLRRGRNQILLILSGVVGGILLWQAAVSFLGLPSYVLPAPLSVFNSLVDGLSRDVTSRASLWYHLWDTLQSTLLGFAIGSAIGLVLAALMSEFPAVRTLALPYVVGLQSMPKVAIAPLMIIWFGYGLSSKVAMATMLTLFPMLVNSLEGFLSTDPDRIQLLKSLKATRWQVFRYVKFPSALPMIFTGMDLAIVYALLGTIVSEFVGAQKGMGVIITQMQTVSDTASVFAALVLLSVVGYLLHEIVRIIQRRVVFWAASTRAGEVAP
jgi:NitT/TauT family transport system permease protein